MKTVAAIGTDFATWSEQRHSAGRGAARLDGLPGLVNAAGSVGQLSQQIDQSRRLATQRGAAAQFNSGIRTAAQASLQARIGAGQRPVQRVVRLGGAAQTPAQVEAWHDERNDASLLRLTEREKAVINNLCNAALDTNLEQFATVDDFLGFLYTQPDPAAALAADASVAAALDPADDDQMAAPDNSHYLLSAAVARTAAPRTNNSITLSHVTTDSGVENINNKAIDTFYGSAGEMGHGFYTVTGHDTVAAEMIRAEWNTKKPLSDVVNFEIDGKLLPALPKPEMELVLHMLQYASGYPKGLSDVVAFINNINNRGEILLFPDDKTIKVNVGLEKPMSWDEFSSDKGKSAPYTPHWLVIAPQRPESLVGVRQVVLRGEKGAEVANAAKRAHQKWYADSSSASPASAPKKSADKKKNAAKRAHQKWYADSSSASPASAPKKSPDKKKNSGREPGQSKIRS